MTAHEIRRNHNATLGVVIDLHGCISDRLKCGDIYVSGNVNDGPGFCFDIEIDGRTYNVEIAGPADSEVRR